MKNWILKIFLSIVLAGTLLFYSGCYPDNSISTSQSDIVMTRYNDSVDFTKLSTYFMADTIYPMSDDTTKIKPVKNQTEYLAEIASQMEKMGYQRIFNDDSIHIPDVIMVVSAIETDNVVVDWWYPYYPGWGWDGYPGWGWGWGGGWYYPPAYYPPYPYYSSYKTGTLLLEMINPNDYDIIKGDTAARVYWNGALNGVLEGSNIKQRVLDGIEQMFTQSPQIKTGN